MPEQHDPMPTRAAVEAMIQQARSLSEAMPTRDPIAGISRAMSIGVTEAILIGMADAFDEDFDAAVVSAHVTEALSMGLASFLMTIAQGDPAALDRLIKVALRQLEASVRSQCASPFGFITGRPDRNAAGRSQ